VLAILAAAAALGALAVGEVALVPNPAGGELSAPSIEIHCAGVLTNTAGGVLELAGPMDRSVDMGNGAGGFVAIGLLDPNLAHSAEATGWERLE